MRVLLYIAICLFISQNSPSGESEETGDSDSDSTFTDLTAAGRAAAALPPASKNSNSLPRVKRHIQQLSSSPLDLQLPACQVSKVVTTPDGMIQRIPYFVRNPRHPLHSCSGDMRHLTASVEELHPLTFYRDYGQLMNSADVRQWSSSGTLIPNTTTWPLPSSSGEFILPLQSSRTLCSITTEELRLLPSSSGSSQWDSQTTSILSRLSPVTHRLPYMEGTEFQLQMLNTQPNSLSPCGELQSRSSSTQPLLQAICTEPQPQSRGQEFKLHQPYVDHQPQQSSPVPYHDASCSEPKAVGVSAEGEMRLGFTDHHLQMGVTNILPRQPCPGKRIPTSTAYQATSIQTLGSEELQVSLKELQPPSAPSEEVEPLLDTIELQPPPSFREPDHIPELEGGSLEDTYRQKMVTGPPVSCQLQPSMSHLPHYTSTYESIAETSSHVSQKRPSPCPALNKVLEQSHDIFANLLWIYL